MALAWSSRQHARGTQCTGYLGPGPPSPCTTYAVVHTSHLPHTCMRPQRSASSPLAAGCGVGKGRLRVAVLAVEAGAARVAVRPAAVRHIGCCWLLLFILLPLLLLLLPLQLLPAAGTASCAACRTPAGCPCACCTRGPAGRASWRGLCGATAAGAPAAAAAAARRLCAAVHRAAARAVLGAELQRCLATRSRAVVATGAGHRAALLAAATMDVQRGWLYIGGAELCLQAPGVGCAPQQQGRRSGGAAATSSGPPRCPLRERWGPAAQ
jgi:hypothetical protein